MVPFLMNGKVAELEVDVDGYKVTVTVDPPRGVDMTEDDAAVILTNAMPHFPQRLRFPDHMKGGFQAQVTTQPNSGRAPARRI